MDTKVDKEPTALDAAKLALALVILLAGMVGYYYYADLPAAVRAVGVIVSLAVAAWVALQTTRGQSLWKFIQASRVELRKVVWPTREETVQTTIAVLVFAAVMGVFFWLLDLFLLSVTQWIMSQGS